MDGTEEEKFNKSIDLIYYYIKMVSSTGFEPVISRPQNERLTKLAYEELIGRKIGNLIQSFCLLRQIFHIFRFIYLLAKRLRF